MIQPLYKQIGSDIIELISLGKIAAGEKVPSVSDIRQKYNVSHVTALRVLKELAVDNYIDYVSGKGYFARNTENFDNKKTINGLIACILRPIRPVTFYDNYYNEINMAVQRECMQRSLNTLYPSCNFPLEENSPPAKALETIMDTISSIVSQVDGFIIDDRIPDSILSKMNGKLNKPVVIVNRKSTLSYDTVSADNKDGAAQAAEMVLKMGYRYFIVGRNACTPTRTVDRCEGFITKLMESGIESDCISDFEYNLEPFEETFKSVEKLLDLNKKILIFCPTDSLARELTDEFTKRNINLGETLGILGFEGMGYATMNKPYVTTVNIHPENIGKKAVDILLSRIYGTYHEKPSSHIVQSTFTLGETV